MALEKTMVKFMFFAFPVYLRLNALLFLIKVPVPILLRTYNHVIINRDILVDEIFGMINSYDFFYG